MNKLVIIILLPLCFKIKGMDTNFNEALKQLAPEKCHYHIKSIGNQIRKLASNPTWQQLLKNPADCNALVSFLAQKCFTQSDPLTAAIKVVYHLNLPPIQEWLKSYLKVHISEKEKVEKNKFAQLLTIDSIPFIEYLRTLNINFNGQDTQGRTWLTYAIMLESIQIAKFFIAHSKELGIDLIAHDINNQTALDYAYSLENTEVVQLLSTADLRVADKRQEDNRISQNAPSSVTQFLKTKELNSIPVILN